MKTKAIAAAFSLFFFYSCNNSGSSTSTSDTTSAMTDHTANTIDTVSSMTNTDTSMSVALNDMDKEFIMKVGIGNTSEINAAKIAQQKSSDTAVKSFAAMMISEHGDAQANLKNIASSLSVSVPDSSDAAHKNAIQKLSSLSGKKFDAEYISSQIKDHKEVVSLFEKEISQGSNQQIKSFATNTLPHIKMHLDKAISIKSGK